jgi:aryl-alcohol dehydrogenase-like predicted oxidoreductase
MSAKDRPANAAWRNNRFTTVVIGARSPEHLDDNVEVLGHSILETLWVDLMSAGLLLEHLPMPAD